MLLETYLEKLPERMAACAPTSDTDTQRAQDDDDDNDFPPQLVLIFDQFEEILTQNQPTKKPATSFLSK